MKVPRTSEIVEVLMGVSGCGKTTVGERLAARLGCPFYDGDDYHPAENVARMASGHPLGDDDRIVERIMEAFNQEIRDE
jgi:carbohydrate kinase (thermoresistant glucokinase family)